MCHTNSHYLNHSTVLDELGLALSVGLLVIAIYQLFTAVKRKWNILLFQNRFLSLENDFTID